jgi:hypothetical protein
VERDEPLFISLHRSLGQAMEVIEVAQYVVSEWRIRGDHRVDRKLEERLTRAVEEYERGN